MLSLIDIDPQIIFPTRDWRTAAKCRDGAIEMVPGNDGTETSKGEEVLLAKKQCSACVVRIQCLDAAGPSAGIWGGLTLDERERIRMSQVRAANPRQIVVCAQCGLDCVPLVRNIWKCDSCLTELERPQSVEALKDNIIAMIQRGHTYTEIGERFGLRKESVGKACRRWNEPSRPGQRVVQGSMDEDDRAPCGTPARLRRHDRDGDKDLKCACVRPGHAVSAKVKRNGWKR